MQDQSPPAGEASAPAPARAVPWRAVAARTPPERDRVVDLLRAGSLLVVVLGHVLMAVVSWHHGTPSIGNVLTQVPELRLATWLLQVMPVFFAAGAIANRISYRAALDRGDPWRAWVWHRVRRFVRPVIAYVTGWLVFGAVLEAVLPDAAGPITRLSTQLLWFLGAYIAVTAATPWAVRIASRGVAGLVGCAAVVAAFDLAKFHVVSQLGLPNFAFVWFFAAVTGLVVRDRVDGARRSLLLMAVAALAANAILVGWFPYPLSLVGLPGEHVSNTNPPSLVLALHAVTLFALLGVAWPALTRFCKHPRAWRAVVLLGSVAMTVYLWHMAALELLIVLEHELAVERGTDATALGFWLATPLHLLAVLGLTAVLVALMARFEYLPIPWLEPPRERQGAARAWDAIVLAGVVVLSAGLVSLSATGVGGFPFDRVTHFHGVDLTSGVGVALFVAGVLLVRAGGRRVPAPGLAATTRRRGG